MYFASNVNSTEKDVTNIKNAYNARSIKMYVTKEMDVFHVYIKQEFAIKKLVDINIVFHVQTIKMDVTTITVQITIKYKDVIHVK